MSNYIEYGYDRKAKSWCIIVFNEKGNEIVSSYVGNKESLEYELELLQKEYSTNKVIKINAY